MPTTITSVEQLKRAIAVAEQIEKLEAELNQILGGNVSTTPAPASSKDPRKGKRSAAVKARMAAAQKARWAAKKGAASESTPPAPKAAKPKKKKGMSAAGRAAIVAAQKARWARTKAAKGPTPEVVGHLLKVETLRPAPAMKAGPGRSIPLSELKTMLEAAPEKTVNIRRAGLQLRNIKVLASANPSLLKLGGTGPWPTVTMLK